MLYKHQYRFRQKHSTIHPIIHLLNHCATSASKPVRKFTLAVLCDISKAFHVINHGILLRKLRTYGIGGLANDWVKSYLSHRLQYVEIENNKSHTLPIGIGVSQGQVLDFYCILYMRMTLVTHARGMFYHSQMIRHYIHHIQISQNYMKMPMNRSMTYIHGSVLIDCR